MSLTSSEKIFIRKLGKRITQLRNEKKLKQIDLSIKLNIDDSSLRRIESGRTNPTIKTLLRVADALEIKLEQLFQFPEENK